MSNAVAAAKQVHVRARVGRAAAPGRRRARRPSVCDLEPLATHDLERLAGPDLLLDVLDRRLVLLGGSLPADVAASARRVSRDDVGGVGAARSAAIASSRATASAYASSTRSSRSSQLIALAISRPAPS